MDAIDLLAPAVTTALTVLAVAWLGRGNNATPEVQDGLMRCRMPKAYSFIGWASIAIGVVMIPGVMIQLSNGWPVAVLLLAVFVLFTWLGLLLVRDGRNHQAAWNEEVLAVVDGHNRLLSCPWSTIASGRVHPLSKMIVLRTTDGRELSLSSYLIGSDALFATMARRTRLPVKDLVAKARAIG